MQMQWLNAQLCIRPETDQEWHWPKNFADMLEGNSFYMKPFPPQVFDFDGDDQKSVTLLDERA